MCGPEARDCHLGWAHRRANPEDTFEEIRTQLFAVKHLIAEATPENAEILMVEGDRSWWSKEMSKETTFAAEVEKTATILMGAGLDKWVVSWLNLSREAR